MPGRHNSSQTTLRFAGSAQFGESQCYKHFAPPGQSSYFLELTMNKRKIIVYIATSADGYIARPDGDVEWLNRRPDTVDYGMKAFYPTIDTILWGRKTYDWALAYAKKTGMKGRLFDTKLANYVFSRKPPKRAEPG